MSDGTADHGTDDRATDLGRRLREAGGDALRALLRDHGDEITAAEALKVLANPHLDRDGVEMLAARRDLLTAYEVKKGIALHPKTPTVLARRLLVGLFWRDLLAAGQDTRLSPALRRAADRTLADRLPGMSLGEKVNIARRAGTGLIVQLRNDPSPRVMSALMENPRLTEGALMPVLSRDTTPGPVLEVVANNNRWGVRYPIRAVLAKNPSTPSQAALRLLPHLKKHDLKAISRDVRIPAPVRKRADLLLGRGPGGGRRR